jgi:hypothetical protein
MARLPTCFALPLLAAAGAASTGCGTSSFGATSEPLGIVPQSATIQGRDGGQSGLVFGHSVWSFGDTVLNMPDAEGTNWHHNSWSFAGLAAGDGIGGLSDRTDTAGAPTYLVAPTDDEAAYNAAHNGNSCTADPCGARFAAWPGAPLWDAAGGRALIFYVLIHGVPGGFSGVGHSLAVWADFASSPQRPEVSPGADHPTLLFGQGDPPWGTGALIEGDTLYALACDTDDYGFDPPCWLASVPSSQALDLQAWTFWDGSTWSTSMAGRASLFTGAASVTLEHNAYLGAYTAVYADPSNRVVIRTAPAITGPWSGPQVLFTADKPEGTAYDAASHPEYEEQDGKVLYFTFSRSNGQGWFGSELALVRVTLP